MNQTTRKISVYISLFIALLCKAHAEEVTYVPVVGNDGKVGVEFKIPYKLGVHDGRSKSLIGEVVLVNNQIKSAHFSVPISSLTTGNSTRDCHMREALGLDYTKSDFPKNHVCDNNQTPETGDNSIVYPNIEFSFTSENQATNTILHLKDGIKEQIQIVGQLTMHGVSQPLKALDDTQGVVLTIEKMAGSDVVHVTAKFGVNIEDYGVIVKAFKVGFIEISVGKKATVDLDLHLLRKQ